MPLHELIPPLLAGIPRAAMHREVVRPAEDLQVAHGRRMAALVQRDAVVDLEPPGAPTRRAAPACGVECSPPNPLPVRDLVSPQPATA